LKSTWHSPDVLVYMGLLLTYLFGAVPCILTIRYKISLFSFHLEGDVLEGSVSSDVSGSLGFWKLEISR